MLQRSSVGFGQVALASLLAENCPLQASETSHKVHSLAPQLPHLAPRARSVIFLFMSGGPSHVDTFDYKPLLERDHDKPMPITKSDKDGRTGNCRKPLRPFRKYGESGIEVSGLFPHVGQCVDDICFIHSMVTVSGGHSPEKLRLHTGSERLIRPTLGSWVVYGLGSENQNLPGFRYDLSPFWIRSQKTVGGSLPATSVSTCFHLDVASLLATCRRFAMPPLATSTRIYHLNYNADS